VRLERADEHLDGCAYEHADAARLQPGELAHVR